MKTEDIFEAFTDIDDKFIASAHPTELNDDQPTVILPMPKKPFWKTLIPVAACLAVLGTAGVFGARYFGERISPETSGDTNVSGVGVFSQNGESNTYTSITGDPDFNKIDIYPTGLRNEFVMEEFPYYTFSVTYKGLFLNGYYMDAVDMQLISADYIENLFICDLNGDGKRELCATVQNGGVSSVEILDFESSDRYISDRKNTYAYLQDEYIADDRVLAMYESSGDCLLLNGSTSPLDWMTHIFSNTSEVVQIYDAQTFELAEFPNLYFIKQDKAVIKGENGSETMRNTVIYGSAEVFLADLNGDGMRELCTLERFGNNLDYRVVIVYDIANDEKYSTESELFGNLIRLELEDGVLNIVTSEYGVATEISREPLTMSMLRKEEKPDYTEVPLYFDQTFTLPDFEGFTFTVDTSTAYPTFDFGWDGNSKGVGNNVDRVFLCDLDGNGRREIIVYNEYTDLGCLKIYGIMDDGGVGSAYYYEKGGFRFVEGGSKLLLETSDGEPFEFSKSDLIPNFAQSYTEILSWDHTIDFTEIYPWCNKYGFSIENQRFRITNDGETIYDSGVELEELYYINDIENDRLYFAYKVKYNGAVGLLELTENSLNNFSLDKGTSLKPTDEALLVVTEYGGKTFVMPEQFRDIIE